MTPSKKPRNQSEEHSKLVNATLLEVGQNFHHIRLWKNHNGMAYTPSSVVDVINYLLGELLGSGEARKKAEMFDIARHKLIPITFGIKGQADLSGILPTGQRLEIEVKTGDGKLMEGQENFRKMITGMGGKHIELRSLADLTQLKQEEFLKMIDMAYVGPSK